MRILTVLLALLALAAFVTPASGQLWVGMGRYQIDDSTDGDNVDNMFRVGHASLTAGATGAATWVSGAMSLGATANQVQMGKGMIDPVNLALLRGWGSLAMVDGNLDLSVPGQHTQIGFNNGSAYITQIGGTLAIGATGKDLYFAGLSSLGMFPQKTHGLSEAYVELKGGRMVLKGTVWVGAHNYYKDANAMGIADDPSGANIGRLTMTGGTLDNSVASGGSSFLVGMRGSDSKAQFLGTSVAMLSALRVGSADRITYVKSSDGLTYTMDRYSKGVLKIGKDATVTADSLTMYDNPNAELQIEIASLTDFSSIACTGAVIIGEASIVGQDSSDKLFIDLQGYDPILGDEWVIATGSTVVAQAFASIIADAPLADPEWSWMSRVDDGNKLVVYIFPEPATLALLAMGGLALIRRRR